MPSLTEQEATALDAAHATVILPGLAAHHAAQSPEPEPEDEPDPDTFVCEHCEFETPDNEAHEVTTRVRWDNASLTYQPCTETWCRDCWYSDCVYIEGYSDDGRTLLATEGRVSESLAQDRYYQHSDGCWHVYAEEEPEDEESDEDVLLNYSTDIFDILDWPRQNRRDALVMGVELEIEARDDNRSRDLVSILGGSRGTKTGKAILKYDGSLEDKRGCEIVTLPFTLDQHRAAGLWDKLLDSRLQAAARSGVGTTNCGMHVHINRRALSALTIGKMVVFLNNPGNSEFVSTVAQRQSGSYCRRDSCKKHSVALHGEEASRYDVINISGGATVEVRMFRGNLRPERVYKNVEFCHALVRFCQSHGITQAQHWGAFVDWLRKQRKEYPHLCAFLAEKHYMPQQYGKIATVADA